MIDSKRLIEDYLPIQAISAEASREKSVRKGHISTLHLWWARRPLVACRATVYGALVPASQFVPNAGSDEKRRSLGRANASKFVTALCQYPGSPHFISEAQQHMLSAHAGRLTQELADWKSGQTGEPGWVSEFKFSGKTVSVDDIKGGHAPRPRVLDMFAGGGAIPLEALRLGCEAHAVELNPVAHIIELCTLVYPQKYGKPDPSSPGMTGPKGKDGKPTWGGLAAEVRHWGEWVLKRVSAEIGDLYPLIPDPEFKGKRAVVQADWLKEHNSAEVPTGYLVPVAYVWTRTVTCRNPNCRATVPLVKQTWLCKKAKKKNKQGKVSSPGRYVAMKVHAPKGKKQARFQVVEAGSEEGLGFDPASFSKGGNATCPFCRTVADDEYVQAEGRAKRVGLQMMAIACASNRTSGKTYISADDIPKFVPDLAAIGERLAETRAKTGITPLNEALNPIRPSPNARGLSAVTRHGLTSFEDLFTARQMLCLVSFANAVKRAGKEMKGEEDRNVAVTTFLAALLDRLADFNSSFCVFNYTGGRGVVHTFGRHALPMVWDFAETNPFNPDGASWISGMEDLPAGLRDADMRNPAVVSRGSATALNIPDSWCDAVITDPPYYDNVPYADVADFFYVWLKRVVGDLYPVHFATELSPKKNEATALASRHSGDMAKANAEYESMMAASFKEAHRVLKPDGQFAVVYAHKTTLGWATLVDALRKAGFTVTEAWPLDTEKTGRLMAQDASALASSIFLIARKRDGSTIGDYEQMVRPELEKIVRERVETLWAMRISGADLVIACVGAGLRAFTRFAQVEYANGDAVPAERFLAEVEGVVLDTILSRLSKEVGATGDRTTLVGMDAPTRFYVLWRYTYGAAPLDAGEAIVFANGTHVELDGSEGLSSGGNSLVEKRKGNYRLREFSERGEDDDLGLPDESGNSSPVIDVLHRLLWLQKRRPRLIPEFLAGARVGMEQLRLVGQSLAGPALKGGELKDVSPTEEQAELGKLLANWQTITAGGEAVERRTGQQKLL